MTTMHPFGAAALTFAAAVLSACGSTAPGHSRVTAADNPAPPAVSGSSKTASTPGDQTGRQPGIAAATRRPAGSLVDVVEISKCYTNATPTSGGQLLIKARSSDLAAHLLAYRPDGVLLGEIQNGGSNRYGGTVIAYQPRDPVTVTIRSSAGGTSTAPTTPFPAEN